MEPAAFATETMSNSVDENNKIADYDSMRERGKQFMETFRKNLRGDPAKAMSVILDVVRGEGVAAGKRWPLYLPLGKEALKAIESKSSLILDSIEDWRDCVNSLDFDE